MSEKGEGSGEGSEELTEEEAEEEEVAEGGEVNREDGRGCFES